jgi:hypothetical protein
VIKKSFLWQRFLLLLAELIKQHGVRVRLTDSRKESIRTHGSLMSDQQKRIVLKITVLRGDKNVF